MRIGLIDRGRKEKEDAGTEGQRRLPLWEAWQGIQNTGESRKARTGYKSGSGEKEEEEVREYLDKEKAIMHLADIALTVSPDEHTKTEDVAIRKAEYNGLATAIGALDEMKAADVAEIVRCKDCKYFYGSDWYCEAWNNSPGFPAVRENGYCFMAERREDG